MKHSKQRDLILNIVQEGMEHLNAYQIYDKVKKHIENISLGTVYRNLNQLSELGMIRKITVPNGNDCFDKTLMNHSHFYCTKCLKLEDIDLDIPITAIEKDKECTIISHDIVLNGICKDCKEKER